MTRSSIKPGVEHRYIERRCQAASGPGRVVARSSDVGALTESCCTFHSPNENKPKPCLCKYADVKLSAGEKVYTQYGKSPIQSMYSSQFVSHRTVVLIWLATCFQCLHANMTNNPRGQTCQTCQMPVVYFIALIFIQGPLYTSGKSCFN